MTRCSRARLERSLNLSRQMIHSGRKTNAFAWWPSTKPATTPPALYLSRDTIREAQRHLSFHGKRVCNWTAVTVAISSSAGCFIAWYEVNVSGSKFVDLFSNLGYSFRFSLHYGQNRAPQILNGIRRSALARSADRVLAGGIAKTKPAIVGYGI